MNVSSQTHANDASLLGKTGHVIMKYQRLRRRAASILRRDVPRLASAGRSYQPSAAGVRTVHAARQNKKKRL